MFPKTPQTKLIATWTCDFHHEGSTPNYPKIIIRVSKNKSKQKITWEILFRRAWCTFLSTILTVASTPSLQTMKLQANALANCYPPTLSMLCSRLNWQCGWSYASAGPISRLPLLTWPFCLRMVIGGSGSMGREDWLVRRAPYLSFTALSD